MEIVFDSASNDQYPLRSTRFANGDRSLSGNLGTDHPLRFAGQAYGDGDQERWSRTGSADSGTGGAFFFFGRSNFQPWPAFAGSRSPRPVLDLSHGVVQYAMRTLEKVAYSAMQPKRGFLQMTNMF